ncbi:hypothetical protein O3Q51_00195 [Cryomorphaceae bacterium 1068]|nr:hypothetical protein [Cryomorphaceae bacterium 1068]
MIRTILILIFSLTASTGFSQETEGNSEEKERRHRITFMPSHTYVKVDVDNKQKWKSFASYGLNYDYWIKENIAIGLHTDLVGASFAVTRFDDKQILERKRPVAVIGVFLYKLKFGLTPVVGLGVEIDDEDQLALLQLGLEYGVEFGKGWEVGANATFDAKVEVYDSITFGLSLSKKL